MSNANNFEVRVDFDRILQTISASIYDNQYAFLRENVQNAIDAVRIQAGRDRVSPGDPRYRIDVTFQENVCSISDNGIGMNRDELRNNFWTMGASGKTTSEAAAAGCIGIFGIGGFANFGVCEKLEVISRTQDCTSAHHTSLSRAAFGVERFALPIVTYKASDELDHRGTIVRGTAPSPFAANELIGYLLQFVRFVREPIYAEGRLISQEEPDSPSGTYRTLADSLTVGDSEFEVDFQLLADAGHNLSLRIVALRIGSNPVAAKGYVRLVHGQLDVYKRGFRICAVSISSRIGVSGFFDADILRPTAGRDTLEAKSITFLTQVFKRIESATWSYILDDGNLLANHTRLLPDFVNHGHLERLGNLNVTAQDKRQYTLAELRELSDQGRRIFFTQSHHASSAAEVLQARGHIIVVSSADHQRKSVEIQFLRKYCKAEEFDNLIEFLEPYTDLDSFERSVLAELEFAIRRMFSPPPFRLSPGKLTLDAPIFWTNKKEGGDTLVLVDTRHGEFKKLRPLGFTPLFWSMIEAFCREYLGDTLKRQSPKFFGTGAIDLDAYSKSHAELWELLSTDIEVSRIQRIDTQSSTPKVRAARIEIVRTADVQRITISSGVGVTSTPEQQSQSGGPEPEPKRLPKILNIVDETGATGLQGYYLRIPESATAAFGELIRTFPTFAVIWFANRITWQTADLESTAFLFGILLDRLIRTGGTKEIGHSSIELPTNKIQSYNDQIYFYIPPEIQGFLVPTPDDAKKIEITHELVDLGKPRAWTSRSPSPSR